MTQALFSLLQESLKGGSYTVKRGHNVTEDVMQLPRSWDDFGGASTFPGMWNTHLFFF